MHSSRAVAAVTRSVWVDAAASIRSIETRSSQEASHEANDSSGYNVTREDCIGWLLVFPGHKQPVDVSFAGSSFSPLHIYAVASRDLRHEVFTRRRESFRLW